ncbi:MAG: hypothetical protein U1E76_07975 [Planctomycetota bacterium]
MRRRAETAGRRGLAPGLGHRTEIARDHRHLSEERLANDDAIGLEPDRRHHQRVELGEDPVDVGIRVAAMETDRVAQIARLASHARRVGGVVVVRHLIAMQVERGGARRQLAECIDCGRTSLARHDRADEAEAKRRRGGGRVTGCAGHRRCWDHVQPIGRARRGSASNCARGPDGTTSTCARSIAARMRS